MIQMRWLQEGRQRTLQWRKSQGGVMVVQPPEGSGLRHDPDAGWGPWQDVPNVVIESERDEDESFESPV